MSVLQAQFFVWRPARWANWMFEIDDYDAAKNTYKFGKGGNQGARGNNKGGDFFVQVRARAWVHACVRACVGACVRACACTHFFDRNIFRVLLRSEYFPSTSSIGIFPRGPRHLCVDTCAEILLLAFVSACSLGCRMCSRSLITRVNSSTTTRPSSSTYGTTVQAHRPAQQSSSCQPSRSCSAAQHSHDAAQRNTATTQRSATQPRRRAAQHSHNAAQRNTATAQHSTRRRRRKNRSL